MKFIIISSLILFLLSFFSNKKIYNPLIFLIFLSISPLLSNDHNNLIKFFSSFLLINTALLLFYKELDLKFDPNILLILNIFSTLSIIISNNLLLIYFLIEIQTFSLFILIGKNKKSLKSIEAAIKYFLLGGISSGLFLLGLIFLYKNSMSLKIDSFNDLSFLNLNSNLSIICLNLSLIFKLAIFPLHYWISDIYEGVRLNILLLLSSLPKLSLLVVLFKIIDNNSFYLIFSLASIIIGSLGAFNQTKINRLIAYSGVVNIGFILLAMNLINCFGFESSITYLIVYFLTLSSLIIYLSPSKNEFIILLNNTWFNNKFLGIVITVLILSISGLPPFLGFFSKWIIFSSLIQNEKFMISFIVILLTAISVGFYLRLIKIIYLQDKSSFLKFENILLRPKILNFNILILVNLIFLLNLIYLTNPNFLILIASWASNL
uniref:NADH:ubiquinone reductase (H(+)-translocating) n=1 Tax=Ectopleura larynx TaxID=264052 RepID=G9ISH7_9CNID|nr:NADH dehydrogenase subunit 2 [Ectopleura larynx]